jgi:hypothetical protein
MSEVRHRPLFYRRVRTPLLVVCLLAFIARVAGQMIVLRRAPSRLPPMKDWYSGLVPYPVLLPVQLAIVALMIWMIRNPPKPRAARAITVFAILYAAAMLVRFILLRTQHPELQWYEGGMIPILFHWVLATFLLTYASGVTPPAARTP